MGIIILLHVLQVKKRVMGVLYLNKSHDVI